MNNDWAFKRKVINYYGKKYRLLWDLLKKSHNTPRNSGLLFCPFHDNYETPAAKYYEDPDAERIWCFAENRFYDLSDYYYKLLGLNLDKLFDQIWCSISDNDKEEFSSIFGEYTYNVEPDDIDKYNKFKNKEINYKELLKELIDEK